MCGSHLHSNLLPSSLLVQIGEMLHVGRTDCRHAQQRIDRIELSFLFYHHKLFELSVSKGCVVTEISWSFLLVQLNCHEKCFPGSGITVFLFMGTSTFGFLRSYPKVFNSSPISFPSSAYFFWQESPHILSFSLINLSRCFL